MSGSGGWSAQGGSTIEVGQGDTLNTISTRYGVPSSAILSANGLSSASQVSAGRRLTIPVYSANARTEAAPRIARQVEPAPARSTEVPAKVRPGQPVTQAAAAPKSHPRPGQPFIASAPPLAQKAEPKTVARLEPKAPRIIELPKKPESTAPVKTSAKAEAAKAEVKVAQSTAEPKAKAMAIAPVPLKAAPQAEPVKPQKVASLGTPTLGKAEPVKEEPKVTASIAPAAPAAPSLGFRWPAKGRVISGFGTSGNEGINIAVPEGTPVKAAEEGTVAYAGGDVKGYGKLVLIRHENGHVSAYAHNGEIAVKQGEKVRRGQVVAKSGATGNVTSPQLHFEIRKGSTPIDPMPQLSGG